MEAELSPRQVRSIIRLWLDAHYRPAQKPDYRRRRVNVPGTLLGLGFAIDVPGAGSSVPGGPGLGGSAPAGPPLPAGGVTHSYTDLFNNNFIETVWVVQSGKWIETSSILVTAA